MRRSSPDRPRQAGRRGGSAGPSGPLPGRTLSGGAGIAWLRTHSWLVALHLGAVAALAVVLALGAADPAAHGPDPLLESGKWALRFLLLCLAMTPLAVYLGWKGAGQLRKPLGLWSFAFALVHVGFGVSSDLTFTRWQWPVAPYLLLGGLALLILMALALTSHRPAMRLLGRGWKRLHRLVYVAGCAAAGHGLLAAVTSKRMLVRDPVAVYELRVMAALVAVALVVRVPALRRLLLSALAPLRRRAVRLPRAAPLTPAVEPMVVPGPLAPSPEPAPVQLGPRRPLAPALDPEEEEELVAG